MTAVPSVAPLFRASLRADVSAIRDLAIGGMLEGTPDSDHRLAWALFPGMPDARRAFTFRIASRHPMPVLELRTNVAPTIGNSSWEVAHVLEPELREGGTYLLETCASLSVSERPSGPKERGKKHDLVSYAVHSLRKGQPLPELEHLGGDAHRQDVVLPVTLAWFWRWRERMGLEIVMSDEGVPMLQARIAEAGCRGPRTAKQGVISMRAIEARALVRITDVSAFSAMVSSGIGRFKSYGYGMIRLTVG